MDRRSFLKAAGVTSLLAPVLIKEVLAAATGVTSIAVSM